MAPQNNLHLLPLALIGSIVSTFIWIALILTIGTISKSSMIAALGAFGVWMGLTIAAGIVAMFTEQAWVLNYLPGEGASGYIGSFDLGSTVSAGPDSLASNLVAYVLNPSADVTYFKISPIPDYPYYRTIPLYTEPLSLILARSIIVVAVYIMVFMFISWFFLRRAEVLE